MKSSLVLFSFLLVLAFTFTSKPFFVLSKTDAVVDNHGNPLQTGVDYYIVSAIRGAAPGGGFNFCAPRQGHCPLAVIQEPLDLNHGHPVKFSRVDGKSGAIPLSTDLNIRFSAELTTCVQSTVWKVGHYDAEVNQYFVVTGGVLGNPSYETVSDWFKIEKEADWYYKIMFCPSVCRSCEVPCKDVGIYFDGEKRRFALSDFPFRVNFIKAWHT